MALRPSSGQAQGITRSDIRPEILTFEDVTVGYDGEPILRGLSFNVRRGEVAGVVALDGRGKTTLVKCAAGLLPPSSGRVLWEGRSVYEMSFAEDQKLRSRTAVVFEGDGALFANRSILDNVGLPIRYHDGARVADAEERALRLLERTGYNEDPRILPWQATARGRRLAAFARALARSPELVLVDRFFEALEVVDAKRLMELVVELNVKDGTSFLLVGELGPALFQVAERVLVLDAGGARAHGFKRSLYEDERIRDAFEHGEDEARGRRGTTRVLASRLAAAATVEVPVTPADAVDGDRGCETPGGGTAGGSSPPRAVEDDDSEKTFTLDAPELEPGEPPRGSTKLDRSKLFPDDKGEG